MIPHFSASAFGAAMFFEGPVGVGILRLPGMIAGH
jgi:hypothetical protein